MSLWIQWVRCEGDLGQDSVCALSPMVPTLTEAQTALWVPGGVC